MRVWPVAKLTLLQGVKERFFIGMLVAELLLLAASYYLSQLAPGDSVKVAMDFALSFVTLLVAFFAAAFTTATLFKDLNEKFVYLVLSRPVSRSDYLGGKLLGIFLTLLLFLVISYALTGIAFIVYSWLIPLYTPHPVLLGRLLLFFLELFFMSVLLASFTVFISLLFTSQTLALAVAVLGFFAGLELSAVKEIVNGSPFVSAFNRAVVNAVYYFYPNFSLFDFKSAVVHLGVEVHSPFFLLTALYSLLYSGALFLASTFLFSRREL
ncbi:ABC transporter permease subunit [Thermovibrio ammonificans]|uniref:ABC transporter permease n=1 Tax=Thermovibrio ammonificans (strain DSM 15698 / JCM 12110 / HB-1) TaxID=648996 RepID=E8T3Q5_THEA1|nr:ABC transporter permease subunit [Thermovibrio ammonificans]ADU97312.1 hypothetical protein Theam_1349 [Thermovibrio ammonificans HB-1]